MASDVTPGQKFAEATGRFDLVTVAGVSRATGFSSLYVEAYLRDNGWNERPHGLWEKPHKETA